MVVCTVSDDRQRINSRTLSVIAAIGAYEEGIAANVVNGKPMAAHTGILLRVRITDTCFTSRLMSSVVSVTPSNRIEGGERNCPRVDHLLLEGEHP